MYRLNDIIKGLSKLVGWQQSFSPDNAIDNELTASESGLTFQGAHPLCTLTNIKSVMPDEFMLQYPEWNMIVPYKRGKKVRYNGRLWIANRDNKGVEPILSDFNADFNNDFGWDTDWVVYNPVSDFIKILTVEGIKKVVQTFIQTKQLLKETRNLLERRTFFDGAARLKATIDPTSKIVGFEIVPVRAMGVTARINRIGLQMVGGTGKVKLYLFHSSQVAPMRTIEVNYTNKNGGFQWFNFDNDPIYLPYISESTGNNIGNDAGGAWFLCYNQDELPEGMDALCVSKDWSREPCGTCNIGSVQGWRELTKYLQISPFCTSAPDDFAQYPEMFDIGSIAYTNTRNYGLNCEVSVGCDLTDFIIGQRDIFATALQRQVAVDVLRLLAMNPDVRVNRNQINVTRDEIIYQIEGNMAGRANGLAYELQQAYKSLSIDTRGIDRICLSCNNHGVKYSHI